MRICVIGGGAAGLMAAATIVEHDPKVEVILLEKNDSLGKKVIISGGGRCNLTTGVQDVKTVLTKYPRGSKFLTKAMHKFSPRMTYDWFEAHGVPLKTEADMRVFPQSNDGHDVVRVFERLFAAFGVKVMLGHGVKGIYRTRAGFEVHVAGKDTPLLADKVILTTGGQAYRQTGSTGDGYAFAVSLGHHITDLAPSLSALFTRETWPAKVAGISFPLVGIGLKGREGRDGTRGPLLFTHKGISGPAVFAFSSLLAFEKFDVHSPLEVSIDLFPDRKADELARTVFLHVQKYPKKSLGNVLGALLPKSFAVEFCLQAGFDPESPAINCGKKCAEQMAKDLKGLLLHVVSRSGGDEFVTAGGVDLKEVDPSTMESKLCPGLFFAGEILDIDGFTGGFNLQSAWATGHLAGQSAT